MAVDVLAVVAAVVLAGLSALHVYWAVGGQGVRAAVVPTVEGRPTLSPSVAATLVVALLLALAALILVGITAGWAPTWLYRAGGAGLSLVLLARAIGDGRTVGFTKRVRDTAFARNDTRLFSPLCLFLAVAAGLATLTA
jgi:hypothetical protein